VIVIGFALLPHIGVVLTSFSAPGSWYQSVIPAKFTTANYVEALGHSMTVSSIRNSLLYSSLAVLANVVLGIAIRVRRGPFRPPRPSPARCAGDAAAGGARPCDGVRPTWRSARGSAT